MTDRLTSILEPTVAGLGYTLLGVERSRGGPAQLLRLYIDAPAGITIEDCERVSRQVGAVLEAEQAIRGEYTLEVSSPGIERPLFTLAQHRPYVGQRIALRLRGPIDGRRRVQGELIEVGTEHLALAVDGLRIEVPYREVDRSRLLHEWPVPARPKARRGADEA